MSNSLVKATSLLVLCAAFLLFSAVAFADKTAKADKSDPNTGEQIKWQVIGNGATDGSSTNYNLKGTVGQPATGNGSSASYNLSQGFWQNFGAGSCFCGDADNNGALSIGDAVYIINYIFASGPAPVQACLADADGNHATSIGDAVFIINYIFAAGPAPSGC